MMDPIKIDITIRTMIKKHNAHLHIRKDDTSSFEVAGTIPTVQGKQKVNSFYFASTIPKVKDCSLYFFLCIQILSILKI